MKRIFHITVTIAMFALLPAVLLAQDELTLESLTETVAGLTERIEVIEGLVADPWSPEIVYTDDGICQNSLHARGEWVSMMKMGVHQETADAYRVKYGTSIDPSSDVWLLSISFSVETNDVYLEYVKDGHKVVEQWAHCEFVGHSEWEEE